MHPLKKEFLNLFEASGWSQAEVARKLEMTRGGINGIVTGETVPSVATVKLFRLILQGEKPGVRMPPHAVLNGKPTAPTQPLGASQELEEHYKAEDWAALLMELNQLSPEDRSNVLDGMRCFMKSIPKSGSKRRAA